MMHRRDAVTRIAAAVAALVLAPRTLWARKPLLPNPVVVEGWYVDADSLVAGEEIRVGQFYFISDKDGKAYGLPGEWTAPFTEEDYRRPWGYWRAK